MDIDEFLDKELQTKKESAEQESSSGTDKVEKIEEKSIEEIKEAGPIKHYFELWKKISDLKLKWDHNLYSELNKAGNEAKESLNKSMLTIDRDKHEVRRLIGKVIRELRNKNYGASTRSYAELSGIRDRIPGFFLEEKKKINKEIFEVYQKLHDQLDSRFIKDFKVSIEKINNLIESAFSNMDIDVDKAKSFYEKALDLYKDLPNGFMPQKLELGKQLITLYKDLSIQSQIKNLRKQLSKGKDYRYTVEDERLKRLSEIIKVRAKPRGLKVSPHPNLRAMPAQGAQPIQNKTLLSHLVDRKLDRAEINLQKGLNLEAKKNIEAILNVDPENVKAKELLNKIPVEY